MSTTFYFVRHGQINRNTSGILPDGIDHSLNELGREQAREVAKNIPSGFDIVISSPLIRALETRQIICDTLGHHSLVITDKRLIEANFGGLKGKTWGEVALLYPNKDLEKEYLLQTYNFNPYFGEYFDQVKERLYSFINEMKQKYEGKKILAVTHAAVVRCLFKVEKDHAFLGAPGNATVYEFIF